MNPSNPPRPIRYSLDRPEAEAFWALFETTGWNNAYRATCDELYTALRHSTTVVSAYHDARLVGIGRLLSDGAIHAVVFDLIVHPDYQRQGIGSEILRRLVESCREAGIHDIQLFAARGASAFYRRHGFQERPDGAPGMELPRRPVIDGSD